MINLMQRSIKTIKQILLRMPIREDLSERSVGLHKGDFENLKKWWIWDCEPVSADKSAIIREYDLNIDYGFEPVSEEEIKMNEKTLSEVKKDLDEACWTGYKQVGMKKKGNRQVPNCVPE